jgi:hypothetical protein
MRSPTWGDTVRIKTGALPLMRPGGLAAVCGIRTIETVEQAEQFSRPIGTALYLVEFDDGTSVEVPESLLEVVQHHLMGRTGPREVMDDNYHVVSGDITDVFSFAESSLIYQDAPLEGLVHKLDSGKRFAFRCKELVPGLVWHWVLVATGESGDVSEVTFDVARRRQHKSVLSILEDHRTTRTRLHFVIIDEKNTNDQLRESLLSIFD